MEDKLNKDKKHEDVVFVGTDLAGECPPLCWSVAGLDGHFLMEVGVVRGTTLFGVPPRSVCDLAERGGVDDVDEDEGLLVRRGGPWRLGLLGNAELPPRPPFDEPAKMGSL